MQTRSGGARIREIAVTWRSPIPETLTDADMLEWRLALSRKYYADEQLVTEEVEPGRAVGDETREIHGIWESAPGAWPAAGPFLTRRTACPAQDRLYLIDSWLYAPGRDSTSTCCSSGMSSTPSFVSRRCRARRCECDAAGREDVKTQRTQKMWG